MFSELSVQIYYRLRLKYQIQLEKKQKKFEKLVQDC